MTWKFESYKKRDGEESVAAAAANANFSKSAKGTGTALACFPRLTAPSVRQCKSTKNFRTTPNQGVVFSSTATLGGRTLNE